jgi:molybdate transport system substrate-binding protein
LRLSVRDFRFALRLQRDLDQPCGWLQAHPGWSFFAADWSREAQRAARSGRSAGQTSLQRQAREERLSMQNVVRVLSTLALMGAVRSLAGRYEAAGGARIDADFAPTLALLDRLRRGEGADVVILTKQALDDLTAQGAVAADSCIDLARSYVGIAVRAGAAHPDIATESALRAALLGARAVAYSRLGASGIFFAQLIERMGIASEINARACIVPQGFTAERLVTGEAELAVQQLSELKQVKGIEVVGPIPLDLQSPAVFSAGRLAASKRVVQSDALLKYLASPEVAPALRESGLEP